MIVLRTFSKAHGLAGLRVGHGFAAPDVVTAIERVSPPFGVNELGIVAACASLLATGELRGAWPSSSPSGGGWNARCGRSGCPSRRVRRTSCGSRRRRCRAGWPWRWNAAVS